jgi:acyl-CoA thioester hydrolase
VQPPPSPFADLPIPGPAGIELAAGEHLHTLRVRYADSDQMGVAYYANYLVWFEVGRTEWLRSRGYAYRDLEARGVFLPVTEAGCRYLAPSRYDDVLHVVTRVGRLGRAVVRFEYRVLREDGTLAATGFTEHCFLSRQGKPVRAPEEIARVLSGGA